MELEIKQASMQDKPANKGKTSVEDKPRRRQIRWLAAGAILGLMVLLMGVLAVIPAVFPAVGAQAADMIRAVLGPDVVASLETASFRIQDAANQRLYAVTGSRPGITLGGQDAAQVAKAGRTPGLLSPQSSQVAASGANALSAQPQIGWQAYGPNVNGGPVMAQGLVHVDPLRPYAGIALVRVDLSKLQLHMEPGFLEPSHDAGILKALPNPGAMPASDVSHLIAAFNGGFKAVNGQYGMMVNGVTLLPPIPGIATLAIYNNGSVRIGAWGTDILPSPDMIAYRQNCPPIIQSGQVNPQVNLDNRGMWGNTVGNKEITWRTGVGITQDGRYLIYAVGNATTVSTLAQALQAAGAYNAMQLDINQHFAHFVTYQVGSNRVVSSVELLAQMENTPTLYLAPHSRDYFYLTAK